MAALQEAVADLGQAVGVVAYRQWRAASVTPRPSVSTITAEYGSWASAVAACGGTPLPGSGGPATWGLADARAAVAEFLATGGRTVTEYSWWCRRHPEERPSVGTVTKVYGEPWAVIVADALGEPSEDVTTMPRWTEVELVDALRAFASDTRPRTLKAYERWRAQQEEVMPSSGTIANRFGGWPAARARAQVASHNTAPAGKDDVT